MKIIECIDVSPLFVSFFFYLSQCSDSDHSAGRHSASCHSVSTWFYYSIFFLSSAKPTKDQNSVLVCLSVLSDSLVPNVDVNL